MRRERERQREVQATPRYKAIRENTLVENTRDVGRKREKIKRRISTSIRTKTMYRIAKVRKLVLLNPAGLVMPQTRPPSYDEARISFSPPGSSLARR